VWEVIIQVNITVEKAKDITLGSEEALAKEWLSPEEDLAWKHL